MAISTKTLLKLGKWRMLLTSLREGEHILKLDRKQAERLRFTIFRANRDGSDEVFFYTSSYRDKVFVVNKIRKEQNGESIE